jgi:hypothetical protein
VDHGWTVANASDGGAQTASLDVKLCQVGGVNRNFASSSGTQYHIQIEDCGPILDRVNEAYVRRVSVIIYANYGEPNARIIFGRNYDLEDVRTHDHNRRVEQRIQDLEAEARQIIEDKEQRHVMRIKCLIREYYLTKHEATKKEFEEANELFPFLFSRAWTELKRERDGKVQSDAPKAALLPVAATEAEAPPEDVLYPIDPALRERVIEIERLIMGVMNGVHTLRERGRADDILVQTCRKLVLRAKEIISGRDASEFTTRRLDMTHQSLLTTWKQIQSRLAAH